MGSSNNKIDLTVKTNHKHPIYFAIHYKYTNGVWYTAGWWSVTNYKYLQTKYHNRK